MKSTTRLSALIFASLMGTSAMALLGNAALAGDTPVADATQTMATKTAVPAADATQTAATETAKPAADVTKTAAAETSKAANPKASLPTLASIKIVDEAAQAVQQVREARLALFSGDTEEAGKLAASAEKALETANGMVDKYAIHAQKPADQAINFIPFGSSLSLSEDFVMTKEKQTSLDKANEHLAKGESTKAVEVLKLADIGLTESVALLPSEAGLAQVKDAAKLIGEKKFYEANLELKAFEDSIIVEAYSVDKVPTQGKKS